MNLIKTYLILIISSISLMMLGQTEQHISVIQKTQIIDNATMTAENPGYLDPDGTPGNELYKVGYTAIVNLVYGRELFTDVTGDLWGFRVEYDILDESDMFISEGNLTIQTFSDNIIYLDQQRVILPSGKAKLEITNVLYSTNEWSSSFQDLFGLAMEVPEDIRLELVVETFRYDYLEQGGGVENILLTSDDGNLAAEWSHYPGAELYHLELGFRTSYPVDLETETDPFLQATRFEVTNNHFSIPATYPPGYVTARVRPVGRYIRDITNPTIEFYLAAGPWSLSDEISVGFETGSNWISKSTYADDGKFKKTVEFFDDAFKSRQTSTTLSAENSVMRATTHYDFEGRPVISVLPAPDLNTNLLGVVNNFNNFPPSAFDDVTLPGLLPSSNGAGLYYSNSNPGNIGIHAQYTPDAEGYPYTRIKYLNDGTGRVISQSGVGELYALGSGHETNYFYDDPSDTQLRRLFGHNVGSAKYYKRNITQDPNGQLSVSYVDISGRTIATALAGLSPSNVIALGSEEGGTYTIVENLMENNVVDTANGESRVVTTIFNEYLDAPPAYLNYSMTGISIEHTEELCLTCSYQLILNITDPCGDSYDPELYPDTIVFTGEDLCSNPNFLNELGPIEINMDQIGLYTITKILRVVPKSMEEWLADLDLILPDSAYFTELFLSQVDTTQCIQTCEQLCRDSLLILYPGLDGQELLDSIDACVLINCLDSIFLDAPLTECEAIRVEMILQLIEGGCLADYWTADTISMLTFIHDGEPVNGVAMYPILTESDIVWEDGWMDTLVLVHPQYCCYEVCLSMISSSRFDYFMPHSFTWEQIESDLFYILERDSFFMAGQPGDGLAGQMEDLLESFGTNDLGDDIDGCELLGYTSPLDLLETINCILPTGTDQEKWNTYVTLYSALKDQLVAGLFEACSLPVEDCENVCHPIPDDFMEMDTVSEAVDFSNMEIMTLCEDVCMGQATIAANTLFESCSSGDWMELYNLLLAHCNDVCGWQNPLGYYLEEDSDLPSYTAIEMWIQGHGCNTDLFDSLITVPFDSVYMTAGYPQNPGVDVIDTVCLEDSINLFVLHDSLYIASLSPELADSLLGDQLFLMDTGMYYFIGLDTTCGDFNNPPMPDYGPGSFTWFIHPMTFLPGDILGSHPEISDFQSPGCYTFGFYTPIAGGACSEYSEITIYVPSCDEPELVIDSLGECVVSAYLLFGPNPAPIDTIIWTVSIDGLPEISYTEGDTLSDGPSYLFKVQVVYDLCCDTLILSDELICPCVFCNEQTVDLCNLSYEGLVDTSGASYFFTSDFQPSCSANNSELNDDIAAELEEFLSILDSCATPEVTWYFLDSPVPVCPCVTFVISNSTLIFDYIFGNLEEPLAYFDTSGCNQAIRISSRSPKDSLDHTIEFASINIFPNPTQNSFYLEFNHSYEINGSYTVQITDFSGALLFSQQFLSDGQFDKQLISPDNIPPGVFKVIVRDSFNLYSTTIVIMR